MTSRDELAETIHKARWPIDRQMAITPFADEDRNGREYCFRIADAILASGVAQCAPDTKAVRKVLGAFYNTVDVMKSARNQKTPMPIWADDMKAVEDVMMFLENLRDSALAQRDALWMALEAIAMRDQEFGFDASKVAREALNSIVRTPEQP